MPEFRTPVKPNKINVIGDTTDGNNFQTDDVETQTMTTNTMDVTQTMVFLETKSGILPAAELPHILVVNNGTFKVWDGTTVQSITTTP